MVKSSADKLLVKVIVSRSLFLFILYIYIRVIINITGLFYIRLIKQSCNSKTINCDI